MKKQDKKSRLNKRELVPLILIVIIFALAVYLYPHMPEQMPIHWNAQGEVDNYGGKFLGLFLLPLVTLGVYILFSIIPLISVYKKHIQKFIKHLYGMKIALILFLSAIYIVTILSALGHDINVAYFILPLISGLLFYIGYIMKFVKRNFFIGIRTPWTLSSGKVWDQTHKIGSITFRIMALVFLLAIFFPDYSIRIILAPVIANVIFLIAINRY